MSSALTLVAAVHFRFWLQHCVLKLILCERTVCTKQISSWNVNPHYICNPVMQGWSGSWKVGHISQTSFLCCLPFLSFIKWCLHLQSKKCWTLDWVNACRFLYQGVRIFPLKSGGRLKLASRFTSILELLLFTLPSVWMKQGVAGVNFTLCYSRQKTAPPRAAFCIKKWLKSILFHQLNWHQNLYSYIFVSSFIQCV